MISLFLAVALPVQVACTNCNGVGYFEVKCPRCDGRGVVRNPRGVGARVKLPDGRYTSNVPCPDCLRGVSRADATARRRFAVNASLKGSVVVLLLRAKSSEIIRSSRMHSLTLDNTTQKMLSYPCCRTIGVVTTGNSISNCSAYE